MLTNDTSIQKRYYISGNKFSGYGLLTLSKLPAYFFYYPYESTLMSRGLLVADTCFNPRETHSGTFLVGNSHLESMNNPKARKEQFDFVIEKLAGHDHIFAGDFNFDYDWYNESGSQLSKIAIK